MERVLVFGPAGVGKSYQALKIARFIQPSGAKMLVLDTDNAYSRMLQEFPGLNNVQTTFAFDWQEYVDWLEKAIPKVRPGLDWLVVDRIDKAWDRVQNYIFEEVYEQSLADRLLEARKRIKKKSAMVVSGADQADWQTINAQYYGWFLALLYKSRANIYLTSAIRLVRDEDSQRVRELYGPVGARPAGQQALQYEPDTVLLFSNPRRREWVVTTVKDRGGRPYYDHSPLVDLGKQYLGGVANWTGGREP